MNQLIRLVYASRSVVTPSATHQGMDPAIARILAKSRKNNARLDVVGGLLFGEGYFLQCLEGDLRIVQNLYSKIENDPRHRDVTVLLQASISTRTFGAWSMKYVPGEQRLQGLLRQWGETTFNPASCATRKMRWTPCPASSRRWLASPIRSCSHPGVPRLAKPSRAGLQRPNPLQHPAAQAS